MCPPLSLAATMTGFAVDVGGPRRATHGAPLRVRAENNNTILPNTLYQEEKQ